MPRPGRWCLVATLALAPTASSAQDVPVALAWRAPGQCPTRDAVLERVTQLRAGAGDAQRLDAAATVTRRADGRWRVRIETPAGTRALQARDCAQLAEATAVVLALALDDLSPAATPDARPTLPPSVEQVSDEERPPVLRPAAPPTPTVTPEALRTALGARVGVDARGMPGGGWSAGLSVAWSRGALRVELAPSVTAGGDGAFEALRAELTTRACVASRGPSQLGLCATVAGGWLRVRAREVDRADDGDAPWIAAGATLLARLGGPRVAAVLTLDALAPVARPRFVVRGGDAWEVPGFTVALGLGAEFTLR